MMSVPRPMIRPVEELVTKSKLSSVPPQQVDRAKVRMRAGCVEQRDSLAAVQAQLAVIRQRGLDASVAVDQPAGVVRDAS
jgi:hypothetical protein